MKEVIWYLPSGAGGIAAQHRSYHIKKAINEWKQYYNIDDEVQLTVFSKDGLRYFKVTMTDETATIFALTWDNSIPRTHFEYINDHIS